jgi:hypothetical protein
MILIILTNDLTSDGKIDTDAAEATEDLPCNLAGKKTIFEYTNYESFLEGDKIFFRVCIPIEQGFRITNDLMKSIKKALFIDYNAPVIWAIHWRMMKDDESRLIDLHVNINDYTLINIIPQTKNSKLDDKFGKWLESCSDGFYSPIFNTNDTLLSYSVQLFNVPITVEMLFSYYDKLRNKLIPYRYDNLFKEFLLKYVISNGTELETQFLECMNKEIDDPQFQEFYIKIKEEFGKLNGADKPYEILYNIRRLIDAEIQK